MPEPKPTNHYHAGATDALPCPSAEAIFLEVSDNLSRSRFVPVVSRAFYLATQIAVALQVAAGQLAQIRSELEDLNNNGIPSVLQCAGALTDQHTAAHARAAGATAVQLQAVANTLARVADNLGLAVDEAAARRTSR
jgi:hypothetical protein